MEKGNNIYVSLSFSETYTYTYISVHSRAYHVFIRQYSSIFLLIKGRQKEKDKDHMYFSYMES
jgi:hypothetical protein